MCTICSFDPEKKNWNDRECLNWLNSLRLVIISIDSFSTVAHFHITVIFWVVIFLWIWKFLSQIARPHYGMERKITIYMYSLVDSARTSRHLKNSSGYKYTVSSKRFNSRRQSDSRGFLHDTYVARMYANILKWLLKKHAFTLVHFCQNSFRNIWNFRFRAPAVFFSWFWIYQKFGNYFFLLEKDTILSVTG